MNPNDLQLDPSIVIRGAIYDSMDPRFLREDLLELDLPSGLTIAVGCVPHCDPQGTFRIVLFRDYWANKKEELETQNLDTALRMIRALSDQYMCAYSKIGDA